MALITEILNGAFNPETKTLKVEVAGGVGGAAMEFLFGSGAPAAGDGNTGDVYLNTSNGDLYKKDPDWEQIGNLRGPQGATGVAGAQGQTGAKGDQGNPGAAGADGVGVEDITADEENLIFHLSDDTTREIPWPTGG